MDFFCKLLSIATLILSFLIPLREVRLLFLSFQINSLRLLFLMLVTSFLNFFLLLIWGKAKVGYVGLKFLYVSNLISFGMTVFYMYALAFLTDFFISLPRRYFALEGGRDIVGGFVQFPILFIFFLVLFFLINITSVGIILNSFLPRKVSPPRLVR